MDSTQQCVPRRANFTAKKAWGGGGGVYDPRLWDALVYTAARLTESQDSGLTAPLKLGGDATQAWEGPPCRCSMCFQSETSPRRCVSREKNMRTMESPQ